MILSCSRLAGDVVVDPLGEDVGRIEHIMLDLSSGRIAFAVIAHGGVLGIGESLVSIPWSALSLDPERGCLVLAMARERFAAAPLYIEDVES